jgi:hypothetical protein
MLTIHYRDYVAQLALGGVGKGEPLRFRCLSRYLCPIHGESKATERQREGILPCSCVHTAAVHGAQSNFVFRDEAKREHWMHNLQARMIRMADSKSYLTSIDGLHMNRNR